MPSPASAIGRSHTVLLSRLLWPTAILFTATLWVILFTILWTSHNVNEVEAERQRSQLESALNQHLGTLQVRLLDFACMPEVLDGIRIASPRKSGSSRFDEQAASLKEFDSVVLVTPDWRVLSGVYNGIPITPASLARLRSLTGSTVTALIGRSEGAPAGAPALPAPDVSPQLLFDGETIYAALALPLTLPSPSDAGTPERAILVAHKTLNVAALRAISAFRDLDGLDVTTHAPEGEMSGLPIRNPNGEVSAYLTWESTRTGDVIRQRLLPMTIAGFGVAVLLFGLVVAYLHWLARDLQATEDSVRRMVGLDPLSGLANRLLFGERLDAALAGLSRAGEHVAVVSIDLDRFKDVNDTHGHKAGDDLILIVAERLRGLVRPGDLIARFGGDEFAIIQTGIRGAADATALARNILDAIAEPFAIARSQVFIGASIGIVVAPEHGTTREILMGLADTALYRAKGEGRNRYVLFQKRMDETLRMRKLVEEDLRHAIETDGLLLHYQPLFSADGQKVVAVEALVRWPHPTRGMISPAEFIPVAEERGLVIPLGEWVLRRACRDGARWPGIRIAVNVSPIQFRHRDFVPTVMAVLEDTGLDPGRLELELTEGVVVGDADAAESAMMDLRALGVHLALDDFGTGYSSLIYLRRFAFDTIKIDRSFLESMEATGESAILVHSMVHLGRALGLTVTAEGVETEEQHRFLQALGCHQLQGFLFSRPVPAEQIDRLVIEGRRVAA